MPLLLWVRRIKKKDRTIRILKRKGLVRPWLLSLSLWRNTFRGLETKFKRPNVCIEALPNMISPSRREIWRRKKMTWKFKVLDEGSVLTLKCLESEEGREWLIKGWNGWPRPLFIGLGGSCSNLRESQLEKFAKTLSGRLGPTNSVFVGPSKPTCRKWTQMIYEWCEALGSPSWDHY